MDDEQIIHTSPEGEHIGLSRAEFAGSRYEHLGYREDKDEEPAADDDVSEQNDDSSEPEKAQPEPVAETPVKDAPRKRSRKRAAA